MVIDSTISFKALESLGLTHDELATAIKLALSNGVKHPTTGETIQLPAMWVTVEDDRTPTICY